MTQLYHLGAANVAHSNTVALSNGLVGYWTMDGVSINWATGQMQGLSGNGGTGSLVNMSTTTSPVAGKIGQGLKFDGTSSINLGKPAKLISLTNNLSVVAWIKSSNFSGNNRIIATDQGNNGFSFALSNNGGLLFTTLGVQDYSTVPLGITTGTWYQVAAVMDSSNNVTFYVNGQYRAKVSGASPGNPNTDNYVIGNLNGVQPVIGLLDDVRVYNRALSATEVMQLYHIGQP